MLAVLSMGPEGELGVVLKWIKRALFISSIPDAIKRVGSSSESCDWRKVTSSSG